MIVQDMGHAVFMDIGQSLIRDPQLFGAELCSLYLNFTKNCLSKKI